jgi:tripartite-type tricarboxylate transporter receptor subunit TctC
MAFGNISAMQPLFREGKMRALAVTSAKRWPSVPELPTMIEAGFKDFESSAWFSLMAPAGTPKEIVDKIHQDTVKVLARADVRERFAALGMEPIGNTPVEFAAAIAAETPQWAKVIKQAGIKAE